MPYRNVYDPGRAQTAFAELNLGSEFDLMWRAEIERSNTAGILGSLRMNPQELKKVLDAIPLPVFTIDISHTVTNWNRACERITGLSREEILGRKDPWKGFYPEKRPVLADLVVDSASEKKIASLYADRYIRSEVFPEIYMGEDFFSRLGENGAWLFFSASPLRDEQDKVIGALEIISDITQCKESEQALKKSEERYRQLFQESALGILLVDSRHTIRDVNPTALEILGYIREEMIGMNGADLIHPDDLRQRSMAANTRKMAAGEPIRVERRYRRKSGEYIPVEVSLRRLAEGEETAHHIVMFHDIVERKQAEERIYRLAYFDELTDLPNRRFFLERLEEAMNSCHLTESGLAVILVDIHRLRAANDTLGQEAGDQLLLEVSHRIKNAVGTSDTLARISGDEFIVLTEGVHSADETHRLCQEILEAIRQPYELFEHLLYPEANLGFTMLGEACAEPDTLIKQADIALNQAKKKTSNIQGFLERDDHVSREFHLEHELKRALTKEEFQVFYQPQIDLNTGRTVGVEALLRWRHPQRGLVSPGEFIPVLERTGMIAAADRGVIHTVCDQLSSWRKKGLSLRASVNLSAQEIGGDSVLRVISGALERTGLDPSLLEIELTETEIMGNVHQAAKILRTLSGWGMSIALDDFGKGYSCMSYLQQLPISVIKIDKEFVDGLPENRDSVTLVQTIITMAHNLGKKALAEGVEYEEQARVLRDLGCDYGQGFLWGRPRPAEDLVLESPTPSQSGI